jgi:hypothetical protein
MSVTVGNAVGVQISMLVAVFMMMVGHLQPLLFYFDYHTLFPEILQAPKGDTVCTQPNYLAFEY